MNPDDYEPRTHTYPEWEGEMTLNGRDFYVIAEITETREPVKKENGKLGNQSFYHFELLVPWNQINSALVKAWALYWTFKEHDPEKAATIRETIVTFTKGMRC